jgi:hypothetical protein
MEFLGKICKSIKKIFCFKETNLEELYVSFTYDEIYKNKCFDDPIYPETFSESSLVFNQDILNNSNPDLDISTENLYDNIN